MKGFTFVETVITVGLTALLFLSFARVFVSFNTLYTTEINAHGAQITAGNIIRAVSSIVLPADRILASHTFTQGTYSTGSTTLVVEIPSVDSSGALQSGHYDYAALYSSASTTYELLAPDGASARRSGLFTLGKPIKNLTLKYDNADPTEAHQVTIDVVASDGGGKSYKTAELTETLRARNLSD